MLSNIIHRDELERRLQESKLWVGVVDAALGVLDDEERLVLDRFYIHQAKGPHGSCVSGSMWNSLQSTVNGTVPCGISLWRCMV